PASGAATAAVEEARSLRPCADCSRLAPAAAGAMVASRRMPSARHDRYISPVASCALRIAVASFTRSCAFPIPDSRFPAILSPMPTADTTERLLRGLYSTALYLLVPVTVYHLIWRGFRQEAYFERWSERYAHYATPAAPTPIWVHAVSVGEVNAVAPLVDALLSAYPGQRLLVTTIPPSGSARVRALWGERVDPVSLPYDLSGAVRRFLAHSAPRVALVVATELWPNLLLCCRDEGIPAYLVNARLS